MPRATTTRSKSSRSTKTANVEQPTNSSTNSPSKTNQSKQTIKHDSSDLDDNTVREFTVPNGGSSIVCNIRPSQPPSNSSLMVFTHGASGTNETLANFAEGFARATSSQENSASGSFEQVSSMICFQGAMNLKSRTTMFHQIIAYCTESSSPPISDGNHHVSVLGGRSMGARAAVITASTDPNVKMLVLVSYPLEAPNGDMRDQILLDINEDIEVLFVIGEKDHMCDLTKLQAVREKMKAKSWLVTVEGTDHGMSFKQKKRTPEMQMTTGRIVADWVNNKAIKTTTGDVGGMDDCRMEMTLPIAPQTKSTTKKDQPARNKENTTTKRSQGSTDGAEAQKPSRQSKRQKTK